MNYLYLLLNILIISGPFLLSFDKKLYFIQYIKYVSVTIFSTFIPFVIWDIIVTQIGHWSFNENFITNFKFINLPIEEALFFITVPYALIFTYEVTNYYNLDRKLKDIKNSLNKLSSKITFIIIVLLFVFAILNIGKGYTLLVSLLSILAMFINYKTKAYSSLSNIFAFTIISILLFLIFNTILTSAPIVIYNPEYITNIRIGTIPVEDFLYNFLIMFTNISFYSYIKRIWN